MKGPVLVLHLMAHGVAIGQGAWSLVFPTTESIRVVTDAVERPSGELSAVSVAYGSFDPPYIPYQADIASVSSAGSLIMQYPFIMEDGWSIYVSDLEQLSGGDVVSVGTAWHQSTGTGAKVVVHPIHPDGPHPSGPHHSFGDSLGRIWDIASVPDPDGGFFITGSLFPPGSTAPSRLFLMRADMEEGILNSAVYGTGSVLRVGRDVVPGNDGTIRVSMDGSIPEAPFGIASILRFNSDLEYVDGFPLISLGGTGNVLPYDSIVRNDLHMTALAADTLIVSGRFGNIFPDGLRAALVRLAPDGSYAGTFLPHSDHPHDFVGTRQGHDMTTDGKIIFAMVENFFPGPPAPELGTTPSRIHIYRLDTLLHVECEHIVDGFDDNAYYYLTRIKAASDGGVLLMGSRRDLNTMGQPQGWIMKLGPDQCTPVGIEEAALHYGVEVFPNPGAEGFTLLLNGPTLPHGLLRLYDAQGREVGTASLRESRATMNTEALPAGIYLYRITDPQGGVRATGRWVRE